MSRNSRASVLVELMAREEDDGGPGDHTVRVQQWRLMLLCRKNPPAHECTKQGHATWAPEGLSLDMREWEGATFSKSLRKKSIWPTEGPQEGHQGCSARLSL